MKESAGTLLYRRNNDQLEVLLVHPSGNYNRRAPWGIPKGLREEGEDLESTARRETLEEVGISPGALVPLSSIDYQKSRKRVHCFAGEAPNSADAAAHLGRSIKPFSCRSTRRGAESIPIRRRFWIACSPSWTRTDSVAANSAAGDASALPARSSAGALAVSPYNHWLSGLFVLHQLDRNRARLWRF